MLSLTDSVTALPGVGDKTTKLLGKLNIQTIVNLLHHYPTRFLDFSHPTPIANLQPKTPASFQATLQQTKQFRTKTNKLITQTLASDKTGCLTLTWFNSPYIQRLIRPQQEYLVAGTPSYFGNQLTIIAPQIEAITTDAIHTKGLVPVYSQTQGITSKWLRRQTKRALNLAKLKETLPLSTIKEHSFLSLPQALKQIHFPQNKLKHSIADRRLSFNQHLRISLINQLETNSLGNAPNLGLNLKQHQKLLSSLPFQLTPDQTKAISKVYQSLKSSSPSHLLIQGDTGSGKTIIAIFAALQALANNYSFCLLAPTQILANQHFKTFKNFHPQPRTVTLVTARSPLKKTSSQPRIYIGTHALLSQLPANLSPPLASIFIDEQHKFGVQQRELLKRRQPPPHLFNLTATPIPRTLALGLFGEIDVATIRHRPKSRLPVKTWVVSNQRFQNSFNWLTKKLKNRHKIFVICPFIDTSNQLNLIKSATKTYQHYRQLFHSTTSVQLIHGKLKDKEKNQILTNFQQADSGILVSTPIIEVGIDIPDANIIIIHSAERFGLAQLHQLRGRVGRGNKQAYCFLVPSTDDDLNIQRLELLTKYHSGLTLAKLDLKLRGAGEIAGLKQHGQFPTQLKYFWNRQLFQIARHCAQKLIAANIKKAKTIASALST